MGSLGQTVNMKTTFIFLACLLGITTGYYVGRIKKDCNKKAEEISAQVCSKQCDVAEQGEDCAGCIMEHKDYYKRCKGEYLIRQCQRTAQEIGDKDCYKQCLRDVVGKGHSYLSDFKKCETCIMNNQHLGKACWASMCSLPEIPNYLIMKNVGAKSLKERCNIKAEEISSHDCKQECSKACPLQSRRDLDMDQRDVCLTCIKN